MIEENKVLLIKHTYQKDWFCPGGGVKGRETYERAIRREAMEEVGAKVRELTLLGVYNNFANQINDTIVVFVSKQFELGESRSPEIQEKAFFDMDHLPEDTSPGIKRRIEEYRAGKGMNHGIW